MSIQAKTRHNLTRFFSLGCLLGPAIWLSNSASARIHKRLCLQSHPSLGKYQSWAVFTLKVLLWFFLLAWISLTSAIYRAYKTPYKNNVNGLTDTALHRLSAFLYLSFWLGVRPQTYFRLKLYTTPRERWVDYAFPQEQTNWHTTLGYADEHPIRAKLADKFTTALILANSNLPTIKSLAHFQANETLSKTQIFIDESIFIKPNSFNAMRGCARLLYKPDSSSYHLIGRDLFLQPISIQGEQDILAYLQKLANKTSFLIQPLLIDHQKLQHCSDDRDISTLRIITCHYNQQIHMVHAMLEVPLKNDEYWESYDIDLSNGELNILPGIDNKAGIRPRTRLPFWQQVCQTVLDGHQSLGKIKTISWDVCIQNDGPIIVEGNSGWDLSAPQSVCQTPLLQGTLKSAYKNTN